MKERLRRLVDLFLDNPVLLKELRIGLRERKIFLIQTLYLLVLGLVTALFLLSVSSPDDLLQLPEQGRNLHSVLFWSQLVMVLLITPSLTCGQISGERENHSLELLRASRLGTVEIVAGKLAYAMSYMGLLLVSSLPMVAVVFLLGGVSPGEIAASYGILALVTLLAGLLGLFYSAREKRTGYATNQAYGTLLLVFLLSMSSIPALLDAMNRGRSLTLGLLVVPLWLAGVFNGACASIFLFLKAQNHLRRRVSHEIWMGRLFLVWFLGDCLFLGAWMDPQGDQEAVAFLWCLGLVATLISEGCFLHPNPFHAPREEARRRAGLAFRWWFWAALLPLGLALAGGVQLGAGGDLAPVQGSAGLCAAVILAFAVITRALHEMLGNRVKFPVLYFLLLAAVLLLPMLPLAGSQGTISFWMGAQLSPLPALWSVWAEAPQVDLAGLPLDMSTACLGTWLGLAVLMVPLVLLRSAWLRRRRPTPGGAA